MSSGRGVAEAPALHQTEGTQNTTQADRTAQHMAPLRYGCQRADSVPQQRHSATLLPLKHSTIRVADTCECQPETHAQAG
jgi:hypothetical protein